MYHRFGLALLICFLFTLKNVSSCERPLEIRGVEDFCWNRNTELGEKISQTEKKFVNFAKRKLGMDTEEPTEPQKCDYYYCVFNEMKVINPQYDVPCIERTSNWIKTNVIYNHALVLLNRVQNCSGELGNVLPKEQYFLADNVDAAPEDRISGDTNEPQSKCEVAKEYMKCLSVVEKDEECPIFEYP